MGKHVADTETDKDAEDIVDVSSLPPGELLVCCIALDFNKIDTPRHCSFYW